MKTIFYWSLLSAGLGVVYVAIVVLFHIVVPGRSRQKYILHKYFGGISLDSRETHSINVCWGRILIVLFGAALLTYPFSTEWSNKLCEYGAWAFGMGLGNCIVLAIFGVISESIEKAYPSWEESEASQCSNSEAQK